MNFTNSISAGTWTAIVTPFKKDQSLDEEALRGLVERQIEAGITGLVPVGTTGESPTTTSAEDMRIFQIVVGQAKDRVPVMAGTGSNCTREAIEYTLAAKKAGANAALVVCPYYNKPTQEGLLKHYLAIAEATAFPMIVYNIKGRTGVNMTTDTLMELAKNDYIVGVKEASGDLEQIKEIMARRPPNFTVLSGDDGLTLPIIKMGGDGVISVASNVLPSQVISLVKMALKGDFASAESKHVFLERLFKELFIETNPIPVKYLLSQMGLCQLQFRLPLCPPSLAAQEKLDNLIEYYGLRNITD